MNRDDKIDVVTNDHEDVDPGPLEIEIKATSGVNRWLEQLSGSEARRIVDTIRKRLGDSFREPSGEDAYVQKVPAKTIVTGLPYRAIRFVDSEDHEWVAMAEALPESAGTRKGFVITDLRDPDSARAIGIDFGRHALGRIGRDR